MRSLPKDERVAVQESLFNYCRLDTYAMYAIYSKLLEIVKG